MIKRLSASLFLTLLLGAAACSARDEQPKPVKTAPAEAAEGHEARSHEVAAAEPTDEAKATPTEADKGADPGPADAPKADDAGDNVCAPLVKAVCDKLGETHDVCGALTTLEGVLEPAACEASSAEGIIARAGAARKVCNELVAKLCADLGEETQTCGMVKRETEKFPVARCAEMMGVYDKVLADLQKMEARNKPLSAELQAKQAAGNVPAFGPADAKVVLVEYSDFECPYCSMAAKTTKLIKEKYGDKIRFVFRQFPLGFHKNAMPAAEASLEAHAQGKFWEMHDKLFENQRALSRADLDKYAAELGLDMDAFKKALDEGTHKAAAQADMKLGEEVGVEGTPTLFVGGARVQNPSDINAISQMIEAELAK